MSDKLQPIGKDFSGYDVLTEAVKDLLNRFPGLHNDETVKFEDLDSKSGIAFSADNGALVFAEKEDVVGTVHQTCQYPFYIVYRTTSATERAKLQIQDFLSMFGKWICREPVEINGVCQQLNAYPALTGDREIKKVTRDNSYGLEPQENGVQDWILPVSIEYTNNYTK